MDGTVLLAGADRVDHKVCCVAEVGCGSRIQTCRMPSEQIVPDVHDGGSTKCARKQNNTTESTKSFMIYVLLC